MSLMESAVDAVHTVLDNNLKTVLDARKLPTIKGYILGEKELDSISDTPMIYIFGDSTTVDAWRPALQWDATHEITVGVVIEDVDSGLLRPRLYEYTRAMIEVIIDSYPFDEFFPRGRIRIEYSPLISRESRFMGDASIRLALQKVENR